MIEKERSFLFQSFVSFLYYNNSSENYEGRDNLWVKQLVQF